ncbi:MAG: diguanylate cyclase, partial [Actinomycetota bacterium]|nr:diguanylate cyclase [Actinomycetota bacterium]
NANAAAGLALAARTDGLTGCLNHAALQEALTRELQRAQRSGEDLSVILLDLDDFKQVNEREGHLVGDEVLRRVGEALRAATRPYDIVARYGGDEFAIIAIEADEAAAHEIASRAVEHVRSSMVALGRPLDAAATAGVADRANHLDGAMLLEEADRALLYGKQVVGRGQAVCASAIPDAYRARTHGLRPNDPGRMATTVPPRRAAAPASLPTTAGAADQHERLLKRSRQLALANALGARLAAMTDAASITDAAVDELHREFGYYLCAAVQIREDDHVCAVATGGAAFQRLGADRWSQPRDAGIIGRALREQTVVLCNDVTRDSSFCATVETAETRSELVASVTVGDRLWGALNLEEARPDAFDDDDARLLQTVADQVGSALRSAELYAQLERAYLGTAEALAAALEAKDAYTAQHATSIAGWAEAVGRRLGLDEAALRTLRYGATFHDLGKIAVPEAILNKPGPLTEEEWEIVKRHTVVGEQILAPVEFLADVLPIVRHEHEHWNGSGYPDGLSGASIPLGARIVLVCDAYHAMTSDRPYRLALDPERAMSELLEHAGSQFDPLVVEALLAVLVAEDAEPARAAPCFEAEGRRAVGACVTAARLSRL